MSKLQQTLQALANDLSRFAGSSGFWGVFADVFGAGYGKSASHAIQALLSRGDLSQLARLEVVSAAVLGPTRAAYASANGTIYLSDRFLSEASQSQLQAALLEEIGHAIDARVNASDRPGDEGELFSLRVRGITPTTSEKQRMMEEDDRRTITVNGVTQQVEQAAQVVYETSKVGAPGSNPSSYYSYKISGTNAIWVEQKRANRTLRFFNGMSSSIIANSVYSDFGDIAISGDTIAYTKSDGQDLEVYRSGAGVTTKLTTNNNNDRNLLIDGNTIAWQSYGDSGNGEIYRNNGTTTRITTNTVEEQDVQLSGNQLLWAASDGNDYEIYINDGSNTRALTNNTVDDYSPVLSGNRAVWLQWNNNQENLFFYDGSIIKQITSNLDISNPVFVGSNLVYKQTNLSGKTSLKFFNTSTGVTSELSANLESFTQVAASDSLVAWLESGTKPPTTSGTPLSTLKLFNGINTTTIATNVLEDSASYGYEYSGKFALRGSKIFYLGKPTDVNHNGGELYLYDTASSVPSSLQLTFEESDYKIESLGVNGDRILWSDGFANLKLTQPSTKPVVLFSSASVSVVEGFTSPQNATIKVNLSAPSSVPVSVRYETDIESASSYLGDYERTAGVLTFAPGVTSQPINVPILNDSHPEPEEVFHVRLFEASNAVIVPGQNTADVTISDTWQTTGANRRNFYLPAGVENLSLTGNTNINGVGNANNNEIRGNSGNNRLNGGGGLDRLIGGSGNDTYVIGDDFPGFNFSSVYENAGEGIDTIEWNPSISSKYNYLAEHVENLTLLGTTNSSIEGNKQNNSLTGNSGHNFIIGGPGADRLTGLGGADYFRYDYAFGNPELHSPALTDSSLNKGIDVITDFNANEGDKFALRNPINFFFNAGLVSIPLFDGILTASIFSDKLTTNNFLPNFAATISVKGGDLPTRTFVVINDAVAGYSANDDALIEVTGWKGTISISSFLP
jgi:Ca2+-binding RTX toxin-like protein